jgi:hypothetical protein
MRKNLILLVGLLALATLPATALAGVVGTVHDLPAFIPYSGAAAKMGTCSFCHLPHKAASGGDKLFPSTYASGLPAAWSTDTLANICWYCHGVAGIGSAQEVNPFQAANHKRSTTKLTAGISAVSLDPGDIAAVPTDLNLTGTDLRCVSCHKIHDNTVKPFLQWGTSGNFNGVSGAGFCGKCHPNRSNTNSAGTNNNGNHFSNTTFADALGSGSPMTGAALPTIMQVDMQALANPIAGAWNLGGHALWSAGTEQNTLVCGTCHAVHSNETAVFDAADGGSVVGAAIAAAGDPVLVAAINPTNAQQAEPICVACHSVVFGYEQRGPGGAGTFSHPIGLASTTATTMRTVLASAAQRWGSDGTNNRIICTSCHDIHWSGTNHTGGTSTAAYLLAYQCSECHNVAGTALANHHPSNIANANTLVQAGAATSSATDWSARTQTKTTVTYFPAGRTTMTCETCHGFGNARAHNNTGGFPSLTGINTCSDMCVDCHSFNPSTYTGHGTTSLGTHYVGTINTASTQYKKTDTFIAAATSNVALYCATGTNGSIICESCHTLKLNGKNTHQVSYQASNNVGDGLADTNDSVSLLLLKSGNSDAFTLASANLCTACHGGAPGGGLTHPVLPGYTTNSTMVPTGRATTTAGHAVGQINCESCHRPHDAATASLSSDWTVAWMLEAASTGTGYTDYSQTCGLCHTNQY